MNRIADTIKQQLGQPGASVLIIGLAILARAIQLLFYLDSFFDTSFQVIATRSLTEGHGISTAIVLPGDLSQVIYQPLNNWPPGYSLLLSPFYLAFGKQYLPACLLLELLAAVAIILLSRKILRLLDTAVYLVNAFTLLTSFFIYYFYYTGSTDSLSIAFFLASIVPVLTLVKTGTNPGWKAVTASVMLLCSASLKYLFFPVVFMVPGSLLAYGIMNRSASLRKAAWFMLAVLGAGIFLLYAYQRAVSGAGTYISATGRGFFPEHLLRIHPSIPGAVLTPNTIRKLPEAPALLIMNLLRVVHVVILLFLAGIAIRDLRRSRISQIPLPRLFLHLSLILILSITGVLVMLSLLVDKELIPPDRWWTYVEDARYYGLSDILIHISLFVLCQQYQSSPKGITRTLFTALPFLLLPEAGRGFIFTARRVMQWNREEYYWAAEKKFFRFGGEAAEKRMQETGTSRLIVTSSVYYGSYRASLHLGAPVLEQSTLLNNTGSLNTREPVVILAIIRKDMQAGFDRFIHAGATRFAGERNGFYFYTYYASPR